MSLRYALLGFSLFLFSLAFSQKNGVKDQSIQTDTLNIKKVKYLLVPLAFYTPETNFAFGGGGQLFFRTKKSKSKKLNSNVFLSGIYTLNKQVMFEVRPQIYFKNENYFLDAKFTYLIFPNSFWGVGPFVPDSLEENYSQTEILVSGTILKKLSGNANFGFNFNFANYNLTEVAERGILAADSLEGSSGATIAGLGFVVNVDSRDNTSSPLGGGLYQFKTNFTSKVMGSTHSFNTYFLDLRKYIGFGKKHFFAMQLYSRLTFGNSPFQAKAYYGGGSVARGFFSGRYIDDHLYVVQVEYRLPILKRWELAFFALTGNVGHNQPEFGLFDDFKSSIGMGPRFFIYKDKRTLLRLDIGLNNFGETGIYFGVNEAF